MMQPPRAGQCHIRFVEESDFAELERMYLEHESESLPQGYFGEFQAVIRGESVFYFVATVDGRVVGGGGISHYLPGVQASLAFGIVDPKECRKGYGTSIMLARFLYIDPGPGGCQILLEATAWSVGFFDRLGFSWYDDAEDDAGNRFFYGDHVVYPGDDRVFQKILEDGGVTLGFEPDRNEGGFMEGALSDLQGEISQKSR